MRLPAACCLAACLCVPAFGAEPSNSQTSAGHPDLEGIWSYATVTPLERPAELAGKEFWTAQEAAAYEKHLKQQVSTDRRDGGAQTDVGRSYNELWRDRGNVLASRRTSIIIDPPDGKLPALTPAAQKRIEAANTHAQAHPADGPEDRSLWERCLTRGLPMYPRSYNNNFQIVQTPGSVAILQEMIHEVRVVRMGGTHAPAVARSFLGDSIGHWEGNTLVVETANFNGSAEFGWSDEVWYNRGLRLTERLTRVGPDELRYQFTVDDPDTFVRPWTGEIIATRTSGPIFEYACHEGNLALTDILSGARTAEKAAKQK